MSSVGAWMLDVREKEVQLLDGAEILTGGFVFGLVRFHRRGLETKTEVSKESGMVTALDALDPLSRRKLKTDLGKTLVKLWTRKKIAKTVRAFRGQQPISI